LIQFFKIEMTAEYPEATHVPEISQKFLSLEIF